MAAQLTSTTGLDAAAAGTAVTTIAGPSPCSRDQPRPHQGTRTGKFQLTPLAGSIAHHLI